MQSDALGYPRSNANLWNSSANSSGTMAERRAVHLPLIADEVGRAETIDAWASRTVVGMLNRSVLLVAQCQWLIDEVGGS